MHRLGADGTVYVVGLGGPHHDAPRDLGGLPAVDGRQRLPQRQAQIDAQPALDDVGRGQGDLPVRKAGHLAQRMDGSWMVAGGQEGLGSLLQGYQEGSNVSVVEEFINLIVS